METMVAQNQNRFFNIFLIYNYVTGCIAAIKLQLCHSLVRSVILFNQIKKMSDKKIVLGFSGGLDTTYCVKYLTEEKGYEVHSIIVNTGGLLKMN